MKSLDELPLDDAIMMYYEKHHAIRNGDMEKLRELKGKCPDLFDKAKDDQLRGLIEYAKKFADTAYYKEKKRLDVKRKLSIISDDDSSQ